MSEFPVLFTIENSNRHEVILVSESDTLKKLNEKLVSVMASSPNAAEFLGKYRNKDHTDSIRELSVVWGQQGSSFFPKATIVTQDNCSALLRMLAASVGRDSRDHIDVKLAPQKQASGTK